VRGEAKGRVATKKPVKLELCSGGVGFTHGGGRQFIGATPCSSERVVRTATTDGEGNFTLKDLPPYAMTLVVELDETNWQERKVECCLDMKPGEVRDLGTL
jgi:hypothetical protein